VKFRNPAGGASGRPVLPTGRRSETVRANDQDYEVSIVDVNNPVVFVAASAVGLIGIELPAELNRDADLLARLDAIRRAAAVRMGLAPDEASARTATPAIPRVIVVSPPRDHVTTLGEHIPANDCDLVARMTSMGPVHHAFPGTGLTVVAVAAALPGTVAYAATRRSDADGTRLAHPKGIVMVAADIDDSQPEIAVAFVGVPRTARRLMTGVAYPLLR
jgi:hypothetical protein